MMLSNSFFITMFATGLVVFIVSIYFAARPPKKINHIYGYRTRRSRKSQEAWDFAQEHSAGEMKMWSVIIMFFSFFGPFLGINNVFGAILGSVFSIFLLLMGVLRTESALKEKFENPDNRV